MWQTLKDIFQPAAAGSADDASQADELQLATAALLVHAALIDGEEDARETERLTELVKQRFDLSDEKAADLIALGRAHDAQAVDFYSFTRVITDQLEPEGRAEIVEMLWEIVLSDKVVDDYEAHLVWRIAELLHVTTRERVVLRRKVMARLGLEE